MACCTRGCYDGTGGLLDVTTLPAGADVLYPRKASKISGAWRGTCEELSAAVTADDINTINSYVFDKAKEYSQFHADIVYDNNLFENNLYFLACDYRKQRKFRRVSNERHSQYASLAETEERVVNGVSGISFYAELEYFNIETQFTNDNFHIWELLFRSIFANWKGKFRWSQFDTTSVQMRCATPCPTQTITNCSCVRCRR